MNRCATLPFFPEDLVGSGRDDLIHVHICGGTGARLKYINGKLIQKFAVNNLLSALTYYIGQIIGKQSQFTVYPG